MSEDHDDASLNWLLSRVDRRCTEAVDDLISFISENISIATADAVTVRALSEDGRSLLPIAAHHPAPMIGSSMAEVMARTVQPADAGLWVPVIQERKPHRWQSEPGRLPVEASAPQRALLEDLPIRAVLGAPLLVEDRVVGGVSVVRFVDRRPFTDRDEALLVACALRLAPTLEYRNRLVRAGSSG